MQQPKPSWLRKRITPSSHYEIDSLLKNLQIQTICQEALCPNISECFSHKQASFLILGNICTRFCSFCAITKAKPQTIDTNEPASVAQAIQHLGLKHVVITSPTRDDLDDGGAKQFAQTSQAIKELDGSVVIELLIPDMQENTNALNIVAHSGAKIIGHNLETIPRLYHIRKGSNYERSLRVLEKLSKLNKDIDTKSAIMLGLGESDKEVKRFMQDLLDVGCKYLSIGQYLAPSTHHTPVVEYVNPKRFEELKMVGLDMGFNHIESSPYTRSSYMAHRYKER
jgi:lipoic acid synthetase